MKIDKTKEFIKKECSWNHNFYMERLAMGIVETLASENPGPNAVGGETKLGGCSPEHKPTAAADPDYVRLSMDKTEESEARAVVRGRALGALTDFLRSCDRDVRDALLNMTDALKSAAYRIRIDQE